MTLTSQVEHGGPLTVEVDGHHIVAGVSSWGLGCGHDGRQFAVYAEVAQANISTSFLLNSTEYDISCGQVRTWIDETIAGSGGAAPCNSTTGRMISGFCANLFAAWNSTAIWGVWGPWSECSQTCDEGSKMRERQCLYEDGVVAASSQCNRCETSDISCSDSSIEYERCDEGLCSGTTGMYVFSI